MWQYSAGTLLKESEVTLDIRPTFSLSIQVTRLDLILSYLNFGCLESLTYKRGFEFSISPMHIVLMAIATATQAAMACKPFCQGRF